MDWDDYYLRDDPVRKKAPEPEEEAECKICGKVITDGSTSTTICDDCCREAFEEHCFNSYSDDGDRLIEELKNSIYRNYYTDEIIRHIFEQDETLARPVKLENKKILNPMYPQVKEKIYS